MTSRVVQESFQEAERSVTHAKAEFEAATNLEDAQRVSQLVSAASSSAEREAAGADRDLGAARRTGSLAVLAPCTEVIDSHGSLR